MAKLAKKKEGREHCGSFVTNYAIHAQDNSFFGWTWIVETSRGEFSHGVDHGVDDKLNELVQPPSFATKG